ncbi:hypothetical protein Salat_2633000 [Sesamum alatum]|uniref:Ubiquitin-like domain-containing protein n=1 Tax=Sesamum alatum TaxID=300844 RepID=A0AAE1XPL4_9LAMI|nr:hypothetical protein Salat_2633000 [Sesamum alatum]
MQRVKIGGGDGDGSGKCESITNLEGALVLSPSNSTFNLCIKSQDGEEFYYRVGREKRMIVVISWYYAKKNVYFDTLCFVYNGRQIKTSKTLAQLGMEDWDIIDAMSTQIGGGY